MISAKTKRFSYLHVQVSQLILRILRILMQTINCMKF